MAEHPRSHDGRPRCAWCGSDPDYVAYHDREWGVPVVDERRLFEKLVLEGFQSGLSWLTILRKREAFRRAFRDFEPERVARFDRRSVARLLGDAGIVRHRGKIEAAIENARRLLELRREGESLARLVWSFEPPPSRRPRRVTARVLARLTESEASRGLSAALRRRGWRYVGPTTMYAFLQAVGVVNDHVEGCHRREPVEQARTRLLRP